MNTDTIRPGELLRRVRTDAGKSMRDLAGALNLGSSWVCDAEHGRNPITPEHVEAICDVLGAEHLPTFERVCTAYVLANLDTVANGWLRWLIPVVRRAQAAPPLVVPFHYPAESPLHPEWDEVSRRTGRRPGPYDHGAWWGVTPPPGYVQLETYSDGTGSPVPACVPSCSAVGDDSGEPSTINVYLGTREQVGPVATLTKETP